MKNIIITGADGNLGNATVPVLIDTGYCVAATVMDKGKPNGLVKHPLLTLEQVNLTNEDESRVFVERTISVLGQVHAGIMLVGGFSMGNIESTTLGDIHKQITLNFETAYNIAQPLVTHFKQKGTGRLVFIGARPALNASDGKNMLAYALSKSLLFKLSEVINEEVKGMDITSTVIVPSTLDTPTNRKSMPDADATAWVNTTELAHIMAFILSDNARALKETVLKVYNRS